MSDSGDELYEFAKRNRERRIVTDVYITYDKISFKWHPSGKGNSYSAILTGDRASVDWEEQVELLRADEAIYVFPSDPTHAAFTRNCIGYFGLKQNCLWNGTHSWDNWNLTRREMRISEINLENYPDVILDVFIKNPSQHTEVRLVREMDEELILLNHKTVCPWTLIPLLNPGNRQYMKMAKTIFGKYGVEPVFERSNHVDVSWIDPTDSTMVLSGNEVNFDWMGDRPGTSSKN